jgi:hypothetical protein
MNRSIWSCSLSPGRRRTASSARAEDAPTVVASDRGKQDRPVEFHPDAVDRIDQAGEGETVESEAGVDADAEALLDRVDTREGVRRLGRSAEGDAVVALRDEQARGDGEHDGERLDLGRLDADDDVAHGVSIAVEDLKQHRLLDGIRRR